MPIQEATIGVPATIRGNRFLGAGLSGWVHRLDAAIKSYRLNEEGDKLREREFAVYKRLGKDETPQQVTDAIAFLHSKGVFHCDISCSNIFLDKDLNAIVGDFSGSSIDDEKCFAWYETSHCHPDTRDPSAKSEVFALGSAFYEMLVGKRPLKGMGDCSIEAEIRHGRFPELESLPALRGPISKCWGQQYDSVDELLWDIRDEAA